MISTIGTIMRDVDGWRGLAAAAVLLLIYFVFLLFVESLRKPPVADSEGRASLVLVSKDLTPHQIEDVLKAATDKAREFEKEKK